MAEHVLDRSTVVTRWNNAYPPRLEIDPGDTLTLQMRDSTDGQVQPGMPPAAYAQIDVLRVHALTGPVAVKGAEPGDALRIEVLDYQHEGWAFTGVIPKLGLLPEDFPEHFLFHWDLEETVTRSMPGTCIDLHPFCGIIGVQRADVGEFRTRPPGAFGGNMDVRHLTAGSTLYLPVATVGAGLCAGDAHAAQGDGEVCINGLEAPMTVTLRVHLEKGAGVNLGGPLILSAPGPLVSRRYESAPYRIFVESAQDSREACRSAVRRAIDWLTGRLSITPEQAYVLCSAVLDLRISQLVNVPMTTVSAYFPEAVFEG
ncbi:MAG: acetamidase/formamidase family protein [Opitutales bacterium]